MFRHVSQFFCIRGYKIGGLNVEKIGDEKTGRNGLKRRIVTLVVTTCIIFTGSIAPQEIMLSGISMVAEAEPDENTAEADGTDTAETGTTDTEGLPVVVLSDEIKGGRQFVQPSGTATVEDEK